MLEKTQLICGILGIALLCAAPLISFADGVCLTRKGRHTKYTRLATCEDCWNDECPEEDGGKEDRLLNDTTKRICKAT